MSDLLLKRSAALSPDGVYRYELRRVWDESLPLLPVCMLNPSTANHEVDDPTVRTLMHFSRMWGYGGLIIVNLFALRTSRPSELRKAAKPMGEDNGGWVVATIAYAKSNGGKMLAAWGNDGEAVIGDYSPARASLFRDLAREHGIKLICLGHTESGAPKHPMARGKHFIPRDQQPLALGGVS